MSTPHDDRVAGESDLDRATAQLRRVGAPRAVEIADTVLERSLNTPRRAALVRARPPHDQLQVSTTVISSVLRDRLDPTLRGAAVGRVATDVDRDGMLRALTLELFVQFGADILALADQTRSLTQSTLADVLGEETGPPDTVPVAVTHVHVSDVTVGDPLLVDPSDE